MIKLVRLRHKFAEKKKIRIMDLKNIWFAGSTTYIINNRSKRRLYDILDSEININTPYDIFLRENIRGDKINGFVFFPFITSISRLLTNLNDTACRDTRRLGLGLVQKDGLD